MRSDTRAKLRTRKSRVAWSFDALHEDSCGVDIFGSRFPLPENSLVVRRCRALARFDARSAGQTRWQKCKAASCTEVYGVKCLHLSRILALALCLAMDPLNVLSQRRGVTSHYSKAGVRWRACSTHLNVTLTMRSGHWFMRYSAPHKIYAQEWGDS